MAVSNSSGTTSAPPNWVRETISRMYLVRTITWTCGLSRRTVATAARAAAAFVAGDSRVGVDDAVGDADVAQDAREVAAVESESDDDHMVGDRRARMLGCRGRGAAQAVRHVSL